MVLDVNSYVEENILSITMQGTLDYSTVDEFNFVDETPDTIEGIVVDFSSLEFIDSTGIGAILTILHRAKKLECDVEFKNISEDTRDLFDVIGVFTIKDALLGKSPHV